MALARRRFADPLLFIETISGSPHRAGQADVCGTGTDRGRKPGTRSEGFQCYASARGASLASL